MRLKEDKLVKEETKQDGREMEGALSNKPIIIKRNNNKLVGNKENVEIPKDNNNQVVKKEPIVISSCESVVRTRKDQFTSSSDNTKSSDHESEKQSICPALPLSSYLPLRKNRRLTQRKNRLKITQGSWSNLSEIPGL